MLIARILAIFSGSFWWCDSSWWPSVTPTMRYCWSLPSWPNMKVAMRVTSVWNASTSRSHIRRKCSVRSAGTPAGRLASSGQLDRRQLLGAGDPLLEVADAGEVLVELLAVGAAELRSPGRGRPPARSRARWPAARFALQAVRVVGLVGEEAVEDQLRVDLRRQRRGRRAPGERVLVDAGVAAVAVARAAVAARCRAPATARRVWSPSRWAATWSAEMPARMLAPAVLRGLGAGEERRQGAGVVAGAVAVGPGLVAGQAAQDDHVVPGSAASGSRIGGSSKSAPSVAGVQSAMLTPLGT